MKRSSTQRGRHQDKSQLLLTYSTRLFDIENEQKRHVSLCARGAGLRAWPRTLSLRHTVMSHFLLPSQQHCAGSVVWQRHSQPTRGICQPPTPATLLVFLKTQLVANLYSELMQLQCKLPTPNAVGCGKLPHSTEGQQDFTKFQLKYNFSIILIICDKILLKQCRISIQFHQKYINLD